LRVHAELLQYVRMMLLADLIWQLLRRPIRMLGPICSLIKSITVCLSNCMIS
jgi:hypothetical protein